MINPYNYIIQPGDYAVVLANNIEEAMFVTEYETKVEFRVNERVLKKPILMNSPLQDELFDTFKANYIENFKSYYCESDKQKTFTVHFEPVKGKIKGHIVIISPTQVLGPIFEAIRERTEKPIVFLMDRVYFFCPLN